MFLQSREEGAEGVEIEREFCFSFLHFLRIDYCNFFTAFAFFNEFHAPDSKRSERKRAREQERAIETKTGELK